MRIWVRSKPVYDMLHPLLQELCDAALVRLNFQLQHGHRGKEEQNRLYRDGASHLKYPLSKHNRSPSWAVDVAPDPYPSNEPDLLLGLGFLVGTIVEIAREHGIQVRVGIDWDMAFDFSRKRFVDAFHCELLSDERLAHG